ncbi:MAG: hypothetical protein SVC26_08400 [Pseudomonadota bacterium]|nr:hypothetical protein [Pseudomonadota bacterium]
MLSEELLIARAGNFTASENHRLMAGWDKAKPDTSFPEYQALRDYIEPLYLSGTDKFLVSDLKPHFAFKVTTALIKQTLDAIKYEIPPSGLVTYAQEKAVEELFEPDPSLVFSTVHTINGEERELECVFLASQQLGVEFTSIGENQSHIHTGEVGCTPDGIVLNEFDMVETGIEAKCKSPKVHAQNLLINTTQDLQANAFDHFVQVQTAMLVTGSSYWYFANFNPYAIQEEHRFKCIKIERDDAFIAILKERIEIAKAIKHAFLEKLKNSTEALASCKA